MSREQLRRLLFELRFKGIEAVLDAELDRAEREDTPVSELLERLFSAEATHRRERRLAYRINEAHMPWRWTLDSFPFERQPGVNKAHIMTLAGMDFLHRAENVVLIGEPGTGKTGIAIGLLREACLNGYKGRFYNAQELLDELYASLADRSTTRLLKRLSAYQPLIVDELGFMSLKPEQSNMFFRLMDQRYNRVSTIISTNLEPNEGWYELFQNKRLVDALLDRLQHHCITIRIKGPSLRSPETPLPTTAQPATSPLHPPATAAAKRSAKSPRRSASK